MRPERKVGTEERLAGVREALGFMPSSLCGLALGALSLHGAWSLATKLLHFDHRAEKVAHPVLLSIGVCSFFLIFLKIALQPRMFLRDLWDPRPICTNYSSGTMAIMALGGALAKRSPTVGAGIWRTGLWLHILLMILFSANRVLQRKPLSFVHPGWLVVYAGVTAGAVTSVGLPVPHWEVKLSFFLGATCYFLLLPVLCFRHFARPKLPVSAAPTICIMMAPGPLILSGWSVVVAPHFQKAIWFPDFLFALSIVFILFVMIQGKLLLWDVAPGAAWSSYTFPTDIVAISFLRFAGFIHPTGPAHHPVLVMAWVPFILANVIVGVVTLLVLKALVTGRLTHRYPLYKPTYTTLDGGAEPRDDLSQPLRPSSFLLQPNGDPEDG